MLKKCLIMLQIRRCVNEILELCFSFSELILRLNTDNFVVSSERQDTLDHISMVCSVYSASTELS